MEGLPDELKQRRLKEAGIQNLIRLALSKLGVVAFRNNVGVAAYADGSRVSYGVGGPGGSDLIGWTTMTIGREHLGRRVAVFTAIEVKGPAGRVSKAQSHFLMTVEAHGGIAGVARSAEEAERLVRSWK